MKYTYEREDLPRIIGILLFLGWCLAQNARVTLYILACAIGLLILLYAIFLLMDLDFDRDRDALEAEIPFVDSYDEYRQTGVDRRKEKSSTPENPDNSGQPCEPCEFTGVVTDAERNAFDWPEFQTPKSKI